MVRKKHVSVVAIQTTNRLKKMLLIKEDWQVEKEISPTGEEIIQIYNLPHGFVKPGETVPSAAKRIMRELGEENFFDELSMPYGPKFLLNPEDSVEHYIVLGTIPYNNVDEPDVGNYFEFHDEKKIWASEMETMFCLHKQLSHDEPFKGNEFIGIDSLIALTLVNEMKLLKG